MAENHASVEGAFPSPNFGPRPAGVQPSFVILHYTEMPLAASRVRLCNPEAQVSAHWLIAEDGALEQLVAEEARAWHAGAGAWGAHDNLNDVSIGIELVNLGPPDGSPPFPEAQMAALETLLRQIMDRWGVPPENVLAHSDIAPTRKEDPGAKFDWRRLARQGLSIWVDPAPSGPPTDDEVDAETVSVFQRAAAEIGYRVDQTGKMDTQTRAVLTAFQRRFRQLEVAAPLSREAVKQAEALVLKGISGA